MQLVMLGEFIQTCKNNYGLLELLNGRSHLLESVHRYSLKDLIESRTLLPVLLQVTEVYSVHITKKCETCRGKGYFCELCKTNEVQFML